MMPVISVVGKPNSGKTSLIEILIKELQNRGYKIATIKHSHKDPSIDVPGKDTWKHAKAGARTVILSSPGKFALIKNLEKELNLNEILIRFSNPKNSKGIFGPNLPARKISKGNFWAHRPKVDREENSGGKSKFRNSGNFGLKFIDGVDLIITEGYKNSDKPKIAVINSIKDLSIIKEPIFAIVSKKHLNFSTQGIPCFNFYDSELVDRIENKFLKSKNEHKTYG